MRVAIHYALRQLVPVAIAVTFSTWLLRDTPPTQVFTLDALTKSVEPGGDLHLRFRGIRHRACPVTSTEEIIDSKGRTFRLTPRLGNPEHESGPFDIVVHTQVPSEAAKGLATFETVAVYGVDPLRLCFTTHIIGPPQRPTTRFWVGPLPQWMSDSKGRAR